MTWFLPLSTEKSVCPRGLGYMLECWTGDDQGNQARMHEINTGCFHEIFPNSMKKAETNYYLTPYTAFEFHEIFYLMCCVCVVICSVETEACQLAQTGLEFSILLPVPQLYRLQYRPEPSCLAEISLTNEVATMAIYYYCQSCVIVNNGCPG